MDKVKKWNAKEKWQSKADEDENECADDVEGKNNTKGE